VVTASVKGSSAADRTRYVVCDRHFRTGDRVAVRTGDKAADAGGCALRERGRGGECDDQPERQLGKSKTGMVHGLVGLDAMDDVARSRASGLGRNGRGSPPRAGLVPVFGVNARLTR